MSDSRTPGSDRELEQLMREALREAEAAGTAGELPIGAVVAVAGEVLSRGRARHLSSRSRLAHAELEARRLRRTAQPPDS